jgi:hypothetical protein
MVVALAILLLYAQFKENEILLKTQLCILLTELISHLKTLIIDQFNTKSKNFAQHCFTPPETRKR